jgi:uncharacterized flavoprotein (TIGR03862 family)
LAELLGKTFNVTIYEQGKAIGRKYLVAGKGGFNIAHNLDRTELYEKYSPTHFLQEAIQHFGVEELRTWYLKMGVPTYIGTSNRVFPEKGVSPANVLRAIKSRLAFLNVEIKTKHTFIGFSEEAQPILKHDESNQIIDATYTVFCLGGGSWKVTGANSDWFAPFNQLGVSTLPFEASNCGLTINWPDSISTNHVGKPLKNIAIKCHDLSVKGEAVITNYGIEGNAIYPISSEIRKSFKSSIPAAITLDFKPMLSSVEIYKKLKKCQPSNYGKVLKLDTASMAIIKQFTTKEEFLSKEILSKTIKNISLPIASLRPIEEAISTVGGIEVENLTPHFSLKKYPHLFCIGEMVNWDAPTGGFLLQGCFSMAHQLANKLLKQN